MLVEAKVKYIRMAPRKVRLVADTVRGMNAEEAQKVLHFIVKRSTNPVLKLLNSAIANAEHNFNMKKENLYIAEIKVDGGPIIKRFRPRARGSTSAIQKKTSHISIKLAEIKEKEGKKDLPKKQKQAKIKTVYQTEKPKEETTKESDVKSKKDIDKSSEKQKEQKGEKKTIFRRKSI